VSSIQNNQYSVYHTTGQVAKVLRVSVSTLKRWIQEERTITEIKENSSGWKLFSNDDIDSLKQYQKKRKKLGKIFKPSTLRPVKK